VLLWTIFGVGYHLVGYAHNSWADWKNGHDKEDPHKQHHPLNTREIDPAWAGFGVFVGVLALGAYTLIITPSEYVLEVTVITLIGASCAWMYNEKGKETSFKVGFIAVAHSTVFIIPYIASGGRINIIFLSGVSMMLLWVTYQILISGELKDLQTDDVNFVRSHSVVDLNGDWKPSESVILLSVLLRVLFGVVCLSLAFAIGADFTTALALIVLTIWSIHLSNKMLSIDYNDRNMAVKDMALIEMVSLFMFVISTSTMYGRVFGVVLIAASVIWVLGFNKMMWSTTIRPEV
jgi:hypothetical protein